MEWVFVIFGLRYFPFLTIGFMLLCSGDKILMWFGSMGLLFEILKNDKK